MDEIGNYTFWATLKAKVDQHSEYIRDVVWWTLKIAP